TALWPAGARPARSRLSRRARRKRSGSRLGPGGPRLADRGPGRPGRLAVGLAGKPVGRTDEDPAARPAGRSAPDLAAITPTGTGAAPGQHTRTRSLGQRRVWPDPGEHGARAPVQSFIPFLIRKLP